jgi:hypothetical protein
MQTHDLVKLILQKTGLTFVDHGTNFSSRWKLSSKTEIQVLVAYDIHPEWVHVLCDVGSAQHYVKEIYVTLLRLNNMVIGSKFALEKNQKIVCSAELSVADLTEDHLKSRITRVVKMVSLFYDKVEKENLKLNSV